MKDIVVKPIEHLNKTGPMKTRTTLTPSKFIYCDEVRLEFPSEDSLDETNKRILAIS